MIGASKIEHVASLIKDLRLRWRWPHRSREDRELLDLIERWANSSDRSACARVRIPASKNSLDASGIRYTRGLDADEGGLERLDGA
jgi:hypothetical protein